MHDRRREQDDAGGASSRGTVRDLAGARSGSPRRRAVSWHHDPNGFLPATAVAALCADQRLTPGVRAREVLPWNESRRGRRRPLQRPAGPDGRAWKSTSPQSEDDLEAELRARGAGVSSGTLRRSAAGRPAWTARAGDSRTRVRVRAALHSARRGGNRAADPERRQRPARGWARAEAEARPSAAGQARHRRHLAGHPPRPRDPAAADAGLPGPGHTGVLIVGDYTTRIGDPSGRSAERPILSDEEIDAERADLSRPGDGRPRPGAHGGAAATASGWRS